MKPGETEPFYERLRRFRKLKGLTALEVANAIGVPASTYREWEYGRTVRGEPYMKLATVFGVSLYELMTGIAPDDGCGLDGNLEKLTQIESLVKEIRASLYCRRQ